MSPRDTQKIPLSSWILRIQESAMIDATKAYGFTALAADPGPEGSITITPSPVEISSLKVPATSLAARIDAYAKSKLDPDTYRHSLRVYCYGCAIARQCFPEFELTPGSHLEETWFFTAMLHDIGTSPEFIANTRLSFEFWGGIHALGLLQDPTIAGGQDVCAPREQAESVAEAIIRHQDIQHSGKITLMTRLIHLGTLLDNIGLGKELVHGKTVENVVNTYPSQGWTECLRTMLQKEKSLKPYAMVTRLERSTK
jgi:cyanamide hydratase